jgi:hypothetical protein
LGGCSLICCKKQHTGNHGLLFPGFHVPKFIKTSNSHSGYQEPQSDHKKSFSVHKTN